MHLFLDQFWHQARGWKKDCSRLSQKHFKARCWADKEVRFISFELCPNTKFQNTLQVPGVVVPWNRMACRSFGVHLYVRQQRLVPNGSKSLHGFVNRHFCCSDNQRWGVGSLCYLVLPYMLLIFQRLLVVEGHQWTMTHSALAQMFILSQVVMLRELLCCSVSSLACRRSQSSFGQHCLLGGSQSAYQGKLKTLLWITCWRFTFFSFRLLLFRHHILDVIGGVVLGFFEVLVMAVIWVGPDTAASLIKWISDDRIAGNDAEII